MKKFVKVLLAATLVLTLFGCGNKQEAVVAVTQSYMAEKLGTEAVDGEAPVSTSQALEALLKWTGMSDEVLGTFPEDYYAFAKSLGLVENEEQFNSDAQLMSDVFNEMMSVCAQVKEAVASDKKIPLFINGMAQPIFPYTSGTTKGYSNENSDILRYSVYVQTDYDTDGDGKLDLVKAVVQLPKSAAEGNYKAATIYEARPYISGCTDIASDLSDIPGEGVGYDMDLLHATPEAIAPTGSMTTLEAAAQASQDEWFYYSPYEGITDYEDIDWYDYYLVRGFAVVESAGIGTYNSQGFETCGSDVEIDAFKAIIEWLTGDRIAFTDLDHYVEIKADWSNGNVGMTGRSYAGTTQFGLAATGVEGLKTIVPVAGIASWYEYYNCQGTTLAGYPYDQVAQLAAYCAGRYIDPEDWDNIKENYGAYLHQLEDDTLAHGNDYSDVWANRDYTLSDNFKCSALIVHGLNDFNVRTKQAELMYDQFKEQGLTVKMLLHLGDHITPTYADTHWPEEDPEGELEPDGLYLDEGSNYTIYDNRAGYSIPVAGYSYDDILNAWFSHYLYDVDNGIDEKLPEALVQSNLDANQWTAYDSYKSANQAIMKLESEEKEVLISSDYASAGYNEECEMTHDEFVTSASTDANAIFSTSLENDLTVKGSVEVDFSAALQSVAENENTDNLVVNVKLVDLSDEPFALYDCPGRHVATDMIAEQGHWMGGGLVHFDSKQFATIDRNYKVIAEGWLDLCNPGSGYNSSSAAEAIVPEIGEYHNYTLFLQPNVYTVQAGHKLALVICSYDPDLCSFSEKAYSFSVDTASVSAIIPVAGDNVELNASYQH